MGNIYYPLDEATVLNLAAGSSEAATAYHELKEAAKSNPELQSLLARLCTKDVAKAIRASSRLYATYSDSHESPDVTKGIEITASQLSAVNKFSDGTQICEVSGMLESIWNNLSGISLL